jgi:hypothetical protein
MSAQTDRQTDSCGCCSIAPVRGRLERVGVTCHNRRRGRRDGEGKGEGRICLKGGVRIAARGDTDTACQLAGLAVWF